MTTTDADARAAFVAVVEERGHALGRIMAAEIIIQALRMLAGGPRERSMNSGSEMCEYRYSMKSYPDGDKLRLEFTCDLDLVPKAEPVPGKGGGW